MKGEATRKAGAGSSSHFGLSGNVLWYVVVRANQRTERVLARVSRLLAKGIVCVVRTSVGRE